MHCEAVFIPESVGIKHRQGIHHRHYQYDLFLASFLREHGADAVSVAPLDYVFDRENPLFARLDAFLRR